MPDSYLIMTNYRRQYDSFKATHGNPKTSEEIQTSKAKYSVIVEKTSGFPVQSISYPNDSS